ncbi:MAG TPA: ATP-binding protein, partial [Polyangiaceae bacterium]
LRESEQRFRNVVQGAPDGVAILRGPVITYLNPRAARMLGLERPEHGYGRVITDFLHPDDRELAVARIRGLVESGKPFDTAHEYRSRSLDGRELTVEISSILIELDGQRAVLAFARDVTERKALQARLAQADRLSALGVLSAGVAHEINNPLAYVLLNLEFIEREVERMVEQGTAPALLQRVREAQHGAERVATIVRDLRTFARDDGGSRGPVRIETAIEAALNIASGEIRRRGRVVRQYREVPAVDGNAARLEQVFVNLLMNAAQALPDDGGAMHEVGIAIREENGNVLVSISDTGVGMSEATLARIFDPFFTTKPPGIGTGLGLPICQGILRAHGGTIEVASAPERGSTFTVTLPAFRGPVMAAVVAPPTPATQARRGRVLIVDDDAAVGRTLSLALEADHDITVVSSAQEALGELRASQRGAGFDAVLCDVLMPGMTGGELFEAAKSEFPEVERRFIFMSGGLWAKGASDFSARVPNRLLEKPFSLEQVRGALREVVIAVHGKAVPSTPP